MPGAIDMTIDKQNSSVEKSSEQNNIRPVLLANILLGSMSALFFAFLGWQTGVWQLYIIALGSAIAVIVALFCLFLVRIGLTHVAAWIILLTMFAVLTNGPLLYQGIGALLGIGAAFLGIFVAGEIFPRKQVERVIVISIGVGAIATLVDMFGSDTRPQAPSIIIIALSVLLSFTLIFIGYNFFRQFKDLSLRVKLIFGMVAVAMLATGGISTAVYITTRNQVQNQVFTSVQDQAHSTAQVFGNYMERQIELLKTLGSNGIVVSGLEEANAKYQGSSAEIQAEIAQLAQQWQIANKSSDPLVQATLTNPTASELKLFRLMYSDHNEVYLTDKYGSIVAGTHRLENYNMANTTWWQAAYNNHQGAVYVSIPEYDADADAYSSFIAIPVLDKNGNFVGVLNSDFRISSVTQRIASARSGESSNASLLFPDGKLLDAAGNISILQPDIQAKVAKSATEYSQFMFQGKERVLSQALLVSNSTEKNFIHSLGWVVVIDEDPIIVTLPLNAVARTSLLIGLATLLIVSYLAAVGGQFLFGPIIRLTRTAEQVRAGDLNSRALVESQDETGILARTFNSTTEQLQSMLQGLEQRVSERTVELEQRSIDLADRTVALELANVRTQKRAAQFQAISDVSRATASVRKLKELLPRIVVVVSEQFGFYHTGIFLVDEAGEYAVLSAASSDGGARMLARGHRLKVGSQGIVGYVTDVGQPRIALDTGKDAVFFDNPDLPDTKSELAIPLKSGGKIIGALDVQSNQSNAFSQEDSDVLQILADQISAAIDNARQFEHTQRSLSEVETIYRQYLRREWDAISQTETVMGYRHTLVGTEPLERLLENSNIDEAMTSGAIQTATDVANDESLLAVPIKLHDEVIGVLNVRAPKKQVWSTDEINMVKSVADRVAISAENARLFEETTNRAERERTVSNITSKIRSTNDPNEMVQIALEELKQALDIKVARIVPYAPPPSQKDS
jgi:GAF domain-containing protein/HAMP domain-containing protein